MDSFSDEFDRKIDRSLKLILLGDMDSRKSEIFHSFMNNKEQESGNIGKLKYTRGSNRRIVVRPIRCYLCRVVVQTSLVHVSLETGIIVRVS